MYCQIADALLTLGISWAGLNPELSKLRSPSRQSLD